MRIHVPDKILIRRRLRRALDHHLDKPPPLLPPNPIASALDPRRDEVTRWVQGQLTGAYRPPPEETVSVSKARHGIRPVACWNLTSRVLYNSLVAALSPSLPSPLRGRRRWHNFQRSPLERRGRYIISADIAACYSLIDHNLLAEELILQTGDHETVTAVLSLISASSGRQYGLPQQSAASDSLAEAFLARIERRLVRQGLVIGRFNDDLRINCADWSQVVRSIEVLSETLRQHGLILNDEKTYVWGRDTYRDHLDEAEALRTDIADEAEIDLTQYEEDDYEGTVFQIEPNPDDVTLLTSVRVLERWQTIAGNGRVPDDKRAEHRAILQLVPLALRELGAYPTEEQAVLDLAMSLLRYEQTLTAPVCRYLSTRNDEGSLLASFDRFIEDGGYLTGWQAWWLQQSLARLSGFSDGSTGERRMRWVRGAFDDAFHSPVLRANAALTLAEHSSIDEAELLRVYDRSSPVVRPTIVAAIGRLKPSRGVRDAVTGDSNLHEWVFDWSTGDA